MAIKLFATSVQEWFQHWYSSIKGQFATSKHGGPESVEVNRSDQCIYCKGWHSRYCGRVKRIRFNDRGDPAEIEYWNDQEWDDSRVIFLDADHIAGEWVFVSVKEDID